MICDEFQIIDNEKSKTVILLNGLFARLESWKHSVDFWKDSHNVLLLNFSGQNNPQNQAEALACKVNIENHCMQILNILNDLEIESVDMLGLSHGGRVALSFATKYPSKINSLVVSNTFLNPDNILSAKLNSWKFATEKGGASTRFDIAVPWVWGRTFLNSNYALIEDYRKAAKIINDSVACELIEAAAERMDFDFSNFTAPCLVLSGNEDLLTPEFYQLEILNSIKQAEHINVHGGHASLLESPLIVKERVIPWVNAQIKQTEDHNIKKGNQNVVFPHN